MTTTKKHRISRVLKELNISLQTAREFLEEKQAFDGALTPNSKIEQNIYQLLSEHFIDDKERKARIDEIYRKKQKNAKPSWALVLLVRNSEHHWR